MISLIFASHHIYTDRLFGFITIFRNTKTSLKLLCNEIPPTQKRKHMMSFGQGFPLPFSQIFFPPDPVLSSVHQTPKTVSSPRKGAEKCYFSIHPCKQLLEFSFWQKIICQISWKTCEKMGRSFPTFFLCMCVEWYMALDIRLDPFFSESLQHICFFWTTQVSFLACLPFFFLVMFAWFLFVWSPFFSPKKTWRSPCESSSHWGIR